MSFIFICIYLFFLVIRPQDWAMPGLEVLRPVLITQALAIGFCILELMDQRLKLPEKLNPWWVLMTGLLGSVALSHLGNTYFVGFKDSLVDFGKIYLTFLVLWINLNHIRRLEYFTIFLVVMSAFISINCILQVQTGTGFGGSSPLVRPIPGTDEFVYQAHYFGIFADPNDTAQLLTLALPLAFFTMVRYSNLFARLGTAVMLGLIIWAIITTESRGGFLSMAITFAVAFRKLFSVRQFTLLTFLGIGFVTLFLPSRFGGGILDDSMTERVGFWGEANYAFINSPIFGVGYGMVTDYIPKNRSVHNSYIHAYTELGVIGYTFWFCCLAFAFLSAWKLADLKPDEEDDQHLLLWFKCIVPGLAGMYASGYFLSRTYQLPLFVVFALCAAAYTIVSRQTGTASLNEYCWINKKYWLLWPAMSIASIIFIYISIRVMNAAA